MTRGGIRLIHGFTKSTLNRNFPDWNYTSVVAYPGGCEGSAHTPWVQGKNSQISLFWAIFCLILSFSTLSGFFPGGTGMSPI